MDATANKGGARAPAGVLFKKTDCSMTLVIVDRAGQRKVVEEIVIRPEDRPEFALKRDVATLDSRNYTVGVAQTVVLVSQTASGELEEANKDSLFVP